MESPLLGTKEVAALLGVTERTVMRMFAAGKIPAFQLDSGCGRKRLWRTTRQMLIEYLNRQMASR